LAEVSSTPEQGRSNKFRSLQVASLSLPIADAMPRTIYGVSTTVVFLADPVYDAVHEVHEACAFLRQARSFAR
jgi:hypothetical protein